MIKIRFDTNGALYNSSTFSQILRPTKTDAGGGPEAGMQFGMAVVEKESLTLGAHAPEGYGSCPVCVSVCLSVCVSVCPKP